MTTDYKVLRKIQLYASADGGESGVADGEAWQELAGTFTAHSGGQAARLACAAYEQEHPGEAAAEYVAVAARSWKPEPLEIEKTPRAVKAR